MNISIIQTDHLDSIKQKKVNELQRICFPDVNSREAELDFYHPETAHVLAYEDATLIGWTGININKVLFENKHITLGGYGICVNPSYRNQGVATKMGLEALSYLKRRGCEIGFLSVDPSDKASVALHKKLGFSLMNTHFSWTNSQGELCTTTGGMITPINNPLLADRILSSQQTFYVGEGYW